jgi:hypothetical protein
MSNKNLWVAVENISGFVRPLASRSLGATLKNGIARLRTGQNGKKSLFYN